MSIIRVLATAGAAFACALACACSRGGPPRQWREFVSDLAGLERLCALEGGVTMVSSFDPSGGNDDFNRFLGRGSEPGWVVLAEAKGPGVVRRFWMTGAEEGHRVRVFFDGERTPRIDAPFDSLFGENWPWVFPLAQYANLCASSYVPLTFNRSIRIETQEPNLNPIWGLRRIFHQINIETMPPGVRVQTYPAAWTDADREAIEKVVALWRKSVLPPNIVWADSDPQPVRIEPGAEAEVFTASGPLMLSSWRLALGPAEPAGWSPLELRDMWQDVVLEVCYDGQVKPSISTPLGDFFGNTAGLRNRGSLFLAGGESGCECRMPMPFAKAIRLTLRNGADRPVSARFAAATANVSPGPWGYLHAQWRRSGPDSQGNHTVADIQGRGKLAGCFLGVTSLDPSWWILEGDERIFIDSELRPSWHGTGLEDYFNGGWYYRGVFLGPLSGSLDRSPFRVAQYRHHLVDPVGFERGIRMDFERMDRGGGPGKVRGMFRSVAFVYLDRPADVGRVPDDRRSRRPDPDPFFRATFPLQLAELERMNDFHAAARAIEEYEQAFPNAAENGVYSLRRLEYRRLLGEKVSDADYKPFLDGIHGSAAAEQARTLVWFHEKPGRALVGLFANGRARLFLDGQLLLSSESPHALYVAGIELADGPHLLAGELDYADNPWFQAGLRTAAGFVGTGFGTKCTRSPGQGWRSTRGQDSDWHAAGIREIPRGVPDAPDPAAVPHAFALLQSKSYPVLAPDFMYYRGKAYFRVEFTAPLDGWPASARRMTGLER